MLWIQLILWFCVILMIKLIHCYQLRMIVKNSLVFYFSKYTILLHVLCSSSTLEAICTLYSFSLIFMLHIALYGCRFPTNILISW